MNLIPRELIVSLTPLPVLVTSTVKTGDDGQPLLIRATVSDARDRRAYEEELLRARRESEREPLQQLNRTLQATLLPPALADAPGPDATAYHHRRHFRRPLHPAGRRRRRPRPPVPSSGVGKATSESNQLTRLCEKAKAENGTLTVYVCADASCGQDRIDQGHLP